MQLRRRGNRHLQRLFHAEEKAEISELHEPDPERRAIYDKLYRCSAVCMRM